MHQQRSKATLIGLQFRALLFLTGLILIGPAIVLLSIGTLGSKPPFITYGAILFGLGILSSLLFTLLSFSWKCPLCVGSVWKKTSCRRNKNAIKRFGLSYRLGVALSVIFRQPYRCPYCGEKFSSTKTRS